MEPGRPGLVRRTVSRWDACTADAGITLVEFEPRDLIAEVPLAHDPWQGRRIGSRGLSPVTERRLGQRRILPRPGRAVANPGLDSIIQLFQ